MSVSPSKLEQNCLCLFDGLIDVVPGPPVSPDMNTQDLTLGKLWPSRFIQSFLFGNTQMVLVGTHSSTHFQMKLVTIETYSFRCVLEDHCITVALKITESTDQAIPEVFLWFSLVQLCAVLTTGFELSNRYLHAGRRSIARWSDFPKWRQGMEW